MTRPNWPVARLAKVIVISPLLDGRPWPTRDQQNLTIRTAQKSVRRSDIDGGNSELSFERSAKRSLGFVPHLSSNITHTRIGLT